MIQVLLQKAWKFITNALPDIDSNGLMNKAMEVSKSQFSTTAVMTMLENYAETKGYKAAFQNNRVWESMRNKKPDEVVLHTTNTLKQMGGMDLLSALIKK